MLEILSLIDYITDKIYYKPPTDKGENMDFGKVIYCTNFQGHSCIHYEKLNATLSGSGISIENLLSYGVPVFNLDNAPMWIVADTRNPKAKLGVYLANDVPQFTNQ